jgi:serine/threonine-protein kinase
MTPERWAEVNRLFDAAHDLPLDRRPSFLEAACAGDADMKAEVSSLLASLDDAGAFLESPAVAEGGAPPRSVGPWELVEEIGRGGMGVVFRARRRDQGFERTAAVKLVKRGMDTDFILRRFENERRILAGLDHPNIARVLDGGSTDEGLPYFVMELIEGRNILAYCQGEKLGTRARLALFSQICSAVQYAHQRLVIHRDIKPSNIVVDSGGTAKLLDFGIARVLAGADGEPAERTVTAFRLFTPDYASPEQVRGESLTTATDVYSLGVVLYELLTGERPYRLKTLRPEELTGAILEQEPPRPSTKVRLHRDLDAIVLAALRKDPGRRYATAEQLGDDIRRQLAGLPVRARADGFGYRLGRFVVRNKLAVAGAAVVAASLFGALGVSVREIGVARAERDRARLEAAKARQVSSFLRGLFEVSDPRRSNGEKLSAQDLIDAGAARVDRELAAQPELRASMLALLGSVYLELGLDGRAEPLLERSLAIREAALGKNHPDVAESLYFLGRLKGFRFDYEGMRDFTERALRIREDRPSDPALAETLSQLAGTFKAVGNLSKARELGERAVAVEERSGGANLHKWLANLAAVEMDLGDFDRARSLLERALAIGLRREGRADAQVDVILLDLAAVFRAQEEYSRALPLFEQALAIDERAFGRQSIAVAYGLAEMGELSFAMGDHARAIDLSRRSIETVERLKGPDHPGLASPLAYQGRVLLAEGRAREALPLFDRALRIYERAFPDEGHAEIATILVDRARATRALEGPAAAEPLFRRALAIQRRVLVDRHRDLVLTLTELGRVVRELGRVDEARRLLTEAVDIARARLPAPHSQRRAAEEALRAALAS